MTKVPVTIYLYRLTHIDNLEYILINRKITCPNHPNKDKKYINIGDTTLIKNRRESRISIAPGGTFSDYVAFYFGTRPPMLYNIQNGFQRVIKRKPEEVIYLVSGLSEVKKTGIPFVFTDGHAYHLMSQFFNRENQLQEIDWHTVKLKQWNDTIDDTDRKRRKQAEFLVHQELPLSAIIAIVVYNDAAKSMVLTKFVETGININTLIKPTWYY